MKALVLTEIEVRGGNVFRRSNGTELFALVSVPHEDGGYTIAHSRWILVGLKTGHTWTSTFSDTPAEALGTDGNWVLVAQSIMDLRRR